MGEDLARGWVISAKVVEDAKNKKGDIALTEVVAKWVVETGYVKFVGNKGIWGYFIEKWKQFFLI